MSSALVLRARAERRGGFAAEEITESEPLASGRGVPPGSRRTPLPPMPYSTFSTPGVAPGAVHLAGTAGKYRWRNGLVPEVKTYDPEVATGTAGRRSASTASKIKRLHRKLNYSTGKARQNGSSEAATSGQRAQCAIAKRQMLCGDEAGFVIRPAHPAGGAKTQQ